MPGFRDYLGAGAPPGPTHRMPDGSVMPGATHPGPMPGPGWPPMPAPQPMAPSGPGAFLALWLQRMNSAYRAGQALGRQMRGPGGY